jgi:serine/threonine-protein kinase
MTERSGDHSSGDHSSDDRAWRAEDALDEVERRRAASDAGSGSMGAALRAYFDEADEVDLPLDPPDPNATVAAELVSGKTATAPKRAEESNAMPPPIDVPNHELLRRLGKGGFGEVWLARQTVTEHHRACKLVPASASVELDGLKRLRQKVPPHPGLFPVDDVGIAGEWLYALMPLADSATKSSGPIGIESYAPLTLEVHLERRGRLMPQDAAAIITEIAEALAHLHEHGITHGDIKPANILRYNDRWTVADYGLMRDLAARTAGTRGEIRPRSGVPQPVADIAAWADPKRTGAAAHMIAFPVRPASDEVWER